MTKGIETQIEELRNSIDRLQKTLDDVCKKKQNNKKKSKTKEKR